MVWASCARTAAPVRATATAGIAKTAPMTEQFHRVIVPPNKTHMTEIAYSGFSHGLLSDRPTGLVSERPAQPSSRASRILGESNGNFLSRRRGNGFNNHGDLVIRGHTAA